MSAAYDDDYRIVLIGDANVGKTCLLHRFSEDSFDPEPHPTIGADYVFKTISFDSQQIRIQFWDASGQSRFRSASAGYLSTAKAVIIVYDVCNAESFQNIDDWMREVSRLCPEDVVKLFIGNKNDLTSDRKISTEQGQQLAKKYGGTFAETSAKSGSNVQQVFLELAGKFKKPIEQLFTPEIKISVPAYKRLCCCSVL